MGLVGYGIDDKMKIKPRTRSVRSITSLILALRLALVDFLVFKTFKSFADLTNIPILPFVSWVQNIRSGVKIVQRSFGSPKERFYTPSRFLIGWARLRNFAFRTAPAFQSILQLCLKERSGFCPDAPQLINAFVLKSYFRVGLKTDEHRLCKGKISSFPEVQKL
jgi:hypothetical protein